MDLAVTLLTQLVNGPLAGLVAWRAARGRAPLACGATVALLVSGAVAAWDPASQQVYSRIAIAVTQASIAILFAVYPDGRFVPRWIIVPAGIEVALQAANLAGGLALESQPWWPWHFALTWAVLLIGGQIYRYRSRSSVDERERTRWPLLAILVMIFGFTLWSFVALGIDGIETIGSASWLANLLLIVPGVGFAVGLLAPRLLRVDRALRWTLQWGLFSCVVSGAAWGLSVALSGLPAAPRAWLTGALTALIALPCMRLTRLTADAVVFGRRADALRTLEELGARLSASVEPRTVPSDIVDTVTGSLGLSFAELVGPAALSATASAASGTPSGAAGAASGAAGATSGAASIVEYPIRYQGELLVTLRVAPRPGDAALTAHDRAVLTQICAQAAPALHSARVVGDLIEARARVVRAREEERKRLRRDLHDELAPTFAGLGLSAAAVEVFARVSDDRAGDAAAELVTGLRAATRQLRDIAYDLRPPALDERGLAAAVQERVVIAGAIPVVTVHAPAQRLALPAAVESAALRIAQEAVMNVRRHAAASACVVTISRHDDDLVIEIADDGIGMQAGQHAGIGLQSMRERAAELGGTFSTSPGTRGGTLVRARLPLATVSPPAATTVLASTTVEVTA